MSGMIKCNKCGGQNSSSTRICEFCGGILEADGKSLMEQLAELDQSMEKLKSFPSPGILDSVKNNAKISMPILSLINLFLALKINELFFITFLFFLVTSIISIFKKKTNYLKDFKLNKLAFNAQIASLYGLYAKDPTTNSRLKQVEAEFNTLNSLYNKSKGFELLMYGVLISLFSVSYFIPALKTESEIKKEATNSEMINLEKVDELLAQGSVNEVNKILNEVKSPETKIHILSKIQISDIKTKITSIESKITNSDFESAKKDLEQIHWKKNSLDFEQETIEEVYFKNYVLLKTDLNNKLPENHRIIVESEIEF
jgi:hypothetical protein